MRALSHRIKGRPGARPSGRRRHEADVKHMKWWGWGEEGVFFNYANKPGFAPFVKKALAVDLRPRKVDTIAFDPTTVPDSPLPMSLRDALVAATSPDHVTVDPHERVVHGHGSSVTELLHVSRFDYGRLPEVVVYPADDDEVAGRAARLRRGGRGGGALRRRHEHLPLAATRPGRDPSDRLARHRPGHRHRRGGRGGRPGPGRCRHAGPRPGGGAERPRLDAGPLPRLVHALHGGRLGGDPLVGHAVRQVRRHRRHRPRHDGGASRRAR